MSNEQLPPCARCGAELMDDDEGDVLLVYLNDEREVERTGEFGKLAEAYCSSCTAIIEGEHRRHDEHIAVFKRELDSWPPKES